MTTRSKPITSSTPRKKPSSSRNAAAKRGLPTGRKPNSPANKSLSHWGLHSKEKPSSSTVTGLFCLTYSCPRCLRQSKLMVQAIANNGDMTLKEIPGCKKSMGSPPTDFRTNRSWKKKPKFETYCDPYLDSKPTVKFR